MSYGENNDMKFWSGEERQYISNSVYISSELCKEVGENLVKGYKNMSFEKRLETPKLACEIEFKHVNVDDEELYYSEYKGMTKDLEKYYNEHKGVFKDIFQLFEESNQKSKNVMKISSTEYVFPGKIRTMSNDGDTDSESSSDSDDSDNDDIEITDVKRPIATKKISERVNNNDDESETGESTSEEEESNNNEESNRNEAENNTKQEENTKIYENDFNIQSI